MSTAVPYHINDVECPLVTDQRAKRERQSTYHSSHTHTRARAICSVGLGACKLVHVHQSDDDGVDEQGVANAQNI